MTIKHRHLFKAAALLISFNLSLALSAENITFSADSMSGSSNDKSTDTHLVGNADIKTDSMEIKADDVRIYGKDFRYISASGSISGTLNESGMTFTCQKMTYDRETKIATLENDVHLVDTTNGVDAEAQFIEYNQNAEVAIMQISVTLKQKDNVCTAAYAIYRKTDQLLEMSGNPKVVQGKDSFRAQEITLNLETQEITLDGRVSGSITTTQSESSSAKPEKPEEPETITAGKDTEPKDKKDE